MAIKYGLASTKRMSSESSERTILEKAANNIVCFLLSQAYHMSCGARQSDKKWVKYVILDLHSGCGSHNSSPLSTIISISTWTIPLHSRQIIQQMKKKMEPISFCPCTVIFPSDSFSPQMPSKWKKNRNGTMEKYKVAKSIRIKKCYMGIHTSYLSSPWNAHVLRSHTSKWALAFAKHTYYMHSFISHIRIIIIKKMVFRFLILFLSFLLSFQRYHLPRSVLCVFAGVEYSQANTQSRSSERERERETASGSGSRSRNHINTPKT